MAPKAPPQDKRSSIAYLPKPVVHLPTTPAFCPARKPFGNESTFRKVTSPDTLNTKYIKDQAQVIDKIKKIDFLISSKSPTAIFSKMKIEDAKMKNEESDFYRVLPVDPQSKKNFRLSRYLNSQL